MPQGAACRYQFLPRHVSDFRLLSCSVTGMALQVFVYVQISSGELRGRVGMCAVRGHMRERVQVTEKKIAGQKGRGAVQGADAYE